MKPASHDFQLRCRPLRSHRAWIWIGFLRKGVNRHTAIGGRIRPGPTSRGTSKVVKEAIKELKTKNISLAVADKTGKFVIMAQDDFKTRIAGVIKKNFVAVKAGLAGI